jgi:lipopolysaccharide export system ATP-binding protein
MQILAVSNVVKVYNKRRVVDRVSLDVKMGEVVGLLGPNGAGKTTTFYMVVGLVKPDEGRILLSGKDITNYPMYRRAREAIGYLAQEPSVFRKMTVEQNIMAILEFSGLSKKEQKERLEILLEELNVARLRKSFGYSLSGGERRRVEIARALAIRPNFILLDEPFAGVDPIAVAEIQKIIRQLKEKGLGVLITDHSVRETLEITDRAYIMSQGRVLVSGTPSEIASSEVARKIYLGENFKIEGVEENSETIDMVSDGTGKEEGKNGENDEIKK